MEYVMAMDALCGLMEKSMMGIGLTMKHMAVENFTLRMVLFMMEDGNIIKLKDMEHIKIKKAINI